MCSLPFQLEKIGSLWSAGVEQSAPESASCPLANVFPTNFLVCLVEFLGVFYLVGVLVLKNDVSRGKSWLYYSFLAIFLAVFLV